MQHVHFLGNINSDNWAGYVGTAILLSFGPASQARLEAFHQALSQMEGVVAQELDPAALLDFSVRQVYLAGPAGWQVQPLSERAFEESRPEPVPGPLLKDVLVLTEDEDALQVAKLLLTRQGEIEVSVLREDKLHGRRFAVEGGVKVARLGPGK